MRSAFHPGPAFGYSRVNGSKGCIEKYLLLKPKRSNLAERPSMSAFYLQSSTDVCLQEFVNPLYEEAENAFFQPNSSISEIAVNLCLKLKTNVSFRLLCCVVAYLWELNLPSDSESEKRVSSRCCVLIFQSEWE